MKSLARRCPALLVVTGILLVTGFSVAHAAKPKQSVQIDQILDRWYQQQGIQPTSVVDDSTFVRRAYQSIAGRIPTVDETRAFLGSKDTHKRPQLIDSLLASDGYVHSMVRFWQNDLKTSHPNLKDFLKTTLHENWPCDKVVRSLISTQSELPTNPSRAYFSMNRGNPYDHMANTVQAFLGTEINCAQCHDHPTNQWSQMDYYGVLAFSYGAFPRKFEKRLNKAFRADERKRLGDKLISPTSLHLIRAMRDAIKQGKMTGMDAMLANTDVRRFYTDEHHFHFFLSFVSQQLQAQERHAGLLEHDTSLKLPEDYQYSDHSPGDVIDAPQVLFGGFQVEENLTPMQKLDAFARWMCSPRNERFALVIANRLWKHAMGRGLIEPADDLGDEPTADVPELMDALEKLMVEVEFDTKEYFRVIYNSRLFEQESLATDPAMGVAYDFRAPIMQRMNGYQVFDSFVALASPYPEPTGLLHDQVTSYRKTLEMRAQGAEILRNTTFEQFYAGYRKWRDPRLSMEAERKVYMIQFKELTLAGKDEEAQALKAAFVKKHGAWTQHTNLRYFNNDSRAPAHARTVYGDEFVEKWQAKAVAIKPRGHEVHFMARCMSDGMSEEEATQAWRGVRATGSLWQRSLDLRSGNRDLGVSATFGGYFVRNATVPQALSLINGKVRTLLSATMKRSPATPVGSVADSETFDGKVDTLFLAFLSRYPTPEERKYVMADLKANQQTAQEANGVATSSAQGKAIKKPTAKNSPAESEWKTLDNLLFALLNSQEFLHIH